jgi:hypothetical protein
LKKITMNTETKLQTIIRDYLAPRLDGIDIWPGERDGELRRPSVVCTSTSSGRDHPRSARIEWRVILRTNGRDETGEGAADAAVWRDAIDDALRIPGDDLGTLFEAAGMACLVWTCDGFAVATMDTGEVDATWTGYALAAQ